MSSAETVMAPANEAMESTYNLDDAEFEAWLSDNESDAWNLECAAMRRAEQNFGY